KLNWGWNYSNPIVFLISKAVLGPDAPTLYIAASSSLNMSSIESLGLKIARSG
ncbi:MAG: hypothetical protein ACJAS1_006417, partial [Oleiphilaceae bacterium]